MYTKLLQAIYRDSDLSEKTASMIEQKVSVYQQKKGQAGKLHWDEEDIFLITYGDQFFEEQQPTLRTFKKFYQKYLADTFRVVHFLPFFPYTSDDGFSVVNYQAINGPFGHMGRYRRNEKRNTVNVRLCLQSYVCRKYLVSGIFKLE